MMVKKSVKKKSATSVNIAASTPPVKGTKKKKPAAVKKTSPKRNGSARPASRQVRDVIPAGVGVGKAWAKCFRYNETTAKKNRMTDDQITAAMQTAFPERNSGTFTVVTNARWRYNAGEFTDTVPTTLSRQYDTNGDPTGDPPGPSKVKRVVKKKATAKKSSTKKSTKKKSKRKK